MEDKKVWYVGFPTYQYKENVKELAIKNGLKIIDSRFQGKNEQCKNAPELTKISEGNENIDYETPMQEYINDIGEEDIIDGFKEKAKDVKLELKKDGTFNAKTITALNGIVAELEAE